MPDVQEVAQVETAQVGRYEHSLYDANTFSVTWELVPGRGAYEKAQQDLMDAAVKAAASGRVHALTITDNPGGGPALSAEMLGAEIGRLGIDPLVHLTCKDKNRNQLESLLYGLERAGVRNLLVMTGDLPEFRLWRRSQAGLRPRPGDAARPYLRAQQRARRFPGRAAKRRRSRRQTSSPGWQPAPSRRSKPSRWGNTTN